MRIARIRTDGGEVPAFAAPGREGWVSAAALGLTLTTADDVVAAADLVRDRLAGAAPDLAEDSALAAPVGRPGKILAVGLNYLAHIAEVGKPRPDEPMIFAKYPSSVSGPSDPIELNPAITQQVDYECELAVVIGRAARNVDRASAAAHVLGYCVANDVSARDVQRSQSQISRSKSLDTFCPIGPWITTADEIADVHALRIGTTVNGETRQDSTTADLLFDVPFLVSYLSQTMTLEPGDVILTGTPSGVASGMTPPRYLAEGDVVRCTVQGLGALENRVVAPVMAR
jgi:5-carboxymethyl-2-hydroxymuconate isomerase